MIKVPTDIHNLGFILHEMGSDENKLQMHDEHAVCLILHVNENTLEIEFVHKIFLASVTISYPNPRLAMFIEQARAAKKKLQELP